MKGTGIRIIIHKPEERVGKNIFGHFVSERGGKLSVTVSHEIIGTTISGTQLVLIPTEVKHPLKSLTQYATVSVDAYLVSADMEPEYVFSGTVNFD